MNTELTAEQRVANGAALLDDKWPGWHAGIDLETMRQESGETCVAAQVMTSTSSPVHRGYSLGWHVFCRAVTSDVAYDPAFGFYTSAYGPDFGFAGSSQRVLDDFAALNAAWRALILERRKS